MLKGENTLKRILALLLALALVFSALSGCGAVRDPDEMLSELAKTAKLEGVIYSSEKREGEDGYMTEELFCRIYLYEGEPPKAYAVLLNSHPTYGAECGAFLYESEDERQRLTDMCEERMALLSEGGENRLLIRSGGVIFYSTHGEPKLIEKLWREIIRA